MSVDALDRRRDAWRLEGASPDVDVARTGPPTTSKPSPAQEPDYDRIPAYEPPAPPAAISAPSNGAVAFEHWDDASLSHQVDALSARLRPGVEYAGRADDQKELADAQQRQLPVAGGGTMAGIVGSVAFTTSLWGPYSRHEALRDPVRLLPRLSRRAA